MKFGAVSFTILVSLTASAFHVVAQESSNQESRIIDFQLASLWQDVPGVTEGMVDAAEAVCRPNLDISLNECDAAFASAPDDPETIELHPFCRQLSNDEFMECVTSEWTTNEWLFEPFSTPQDNISNKSGRDPQRTAPS